MTLCIWNSIPCNLRQVQNLVQCVNKNFPFILGFQSSHIFGCLHTDGDGKVLGAFLFEVINFNPHKII